MNKILPTFSVPGAVYATISALQKTKFEWISCTYEIFQAYIIHNIQPPNRWLIEQIHRVQAIFNVVDVGMICWSGAKLLQEVKKIYGFSFVNPLDTSQLLSYRLLSLGIPAIGLPLAIKMLSTLNYPMSPLYKTSNDYPFNQKLSMLLCTARLRAF